MVNLRLVRNATSVEKPLPRPPRFLPQAARGDIVTDLGRRDGFGSSRDIPRGWAMTLQPGANRAVHDNLLRHLLLPTREPQL